MHKHIPVSRRRFIRSAGIAGLSALLPSWTQSLAQNSGSGEINLDIGYTNVTVHRRRASATGINGTVPGPLIRLQEGQRAILNVRNSMDEESSIHWHGLLLPSNMDGVPGLSFAGIKPGEYYRYEFDVVQNGTYWYHSHSGLQEQTGVYGPLIIDPAGEDPVDYDIDYIVMLSDWTFEDPNRLYARLKKMDDYYNRQKRTVADFFRDVEQKGWRATMADRRMWGQMRMAASDIADVTGETYTYLMNGHDPDANWTGLFEPGQKIRLRIINGSAMTFFNFRIPGLEMIVVQNDGQNVHPVTVDELQIGVAETYDVVVQPESNDAFTLFAESMDRSGFALGTLAPERGMIAAVPALRSRPLLTMADMGMDHSNMQNNDMDHAAMGHHMAEPANMGMDQGNTQNNDMDHAAMGHHMADSPAMKTVHHNHPVGPGVANLTSMPADRLAEPGIGLHDVPHRVLTYADLRCVEPNSDLRVPERKIELHLTGNMERYMWSFDGVKYEHVDGPIVFNYGERLRIVLVNDTMMSHPIHLHGMFIELDNGNGPLNPRKHTVVVKPGERLAMNLTADAVGRWAFHCHMLYHMKGGMMREVRVVDNRGDIS